MRRVFPCALVRLLASVRTARPDRSGGADHELDGRDALLRGGVGQERRTVHVANGVDRFTGSAHLFVDFDIAAIEFYTQRFQAQTGSAP